MSDARNDELERFLLQAREIHRRVAQECRETRAVMFTDVTGSTSFFERHGDFGGLLLLREYNRVMTPIIAGHGGSIVKTLGDGLLVVFPTVNEAGRAAVQMQQRTQEASLDSSGASAVAITIAIHAGDIFRYNDDVFGDVINVTARVSSFTNPSTILMTEAARRQLDESEFLTSFATKAYMKGKAEPIELFHIYWRAEELDKLRGASVDKRTRAFVSTATPHTDAQVRFLEAFSRRLFAVGVEPCSSGRLPTTRRTQSERSRAR